MTERDIQTGLIGEAARVPSPATLFFRRNGPWRSDGNAGSPWV